MVRIVDDLTSNLQSGVRLAFFRPCESGDFRINLDQLVVLLSLDLSLEILSDFILALPKPDFIVYALPTYTFNVSCFFIAAYLIGKPLKRTGAALQIGVIVYSFAPLSIVCEAGLELLHKFSPPSSLKTVYWLEQLFSIYIVAVIFRVLYIVSGRLKRIAVPSLMLMIAMLSPTQILFSDYRDFWFARENAGESQQADPYAEYRSLDAETLMYRQPEIVSKALAKLKPQNARMTDIYFVGFAGYAMENVFSNEVVYAKQLLDRRFNTQGHSINLINDLGTIEDTPLATATNLALTLNRIGKLMDVENDVLLIYLTSHGSRKQGLTVSFWPLALNDITPGKLKTILDESGIKWRVIVISACYSGAFVNALQGPTTLVATASAADKTSFGCGTESEFTYFGEAVFKNQLSRQHSLISALRQAAVSIRQREQRENLEASMPQLSVGAAIEPKLQRLSELMQQYQCSVDKTNPDDC